MSPVEVVVARVLAEHHPAGIVNSREGWVECECGEHLPVALDRDGYALDTDADRAAFDAHRAATQVAAIRVDEGLRQEAAQGIHDAECEAYRHEGRNGKCERQARAALDAITRDAQ